MPEDDKKQEPKESEVVQALKAEYEKQLKEQKENYEKQIDGIFLLRTSLIFSAINILRKQRHLKSDIRKNIKKSLICLNFSGPAAYSKNTIL